MKYKVQSASSGLSQGKVCTLCGERAWMYTSTKGEYRCWKFMMSGICKY